jgi:hypothetical protein
LISPPLPRWHEITDDGLRTDHQAAAADALHRPEGDQFGQRGGQSRQRRTGQEMTIAAWKNAFRPYRSPSLPQGGVDTVDASR